MISTKTRALKNNQTQEEEKDSFDTVNDKAAIGLIKVLLHSASEPIAWMKDNLNLNNISSNRLKQLIEHLVSTSHASSSEIIASLPNEKDRKIITELMMEEDSSIDFMQMSIECINTLSNETTKDKIQNYRQEIRKLEAEGGDTTDLMNKISEIQKDINA